MIRQAHSYLVGAVSGAALIAAAVVVFILLLVSTQGFRDLPLVDAGGDESAGIAPARPAVAESPSGAPVGGTGGRSGDADRSASSPRQSDLAAGGAQGTATSPASSGPGAGGGGSDPSPGSASTPASGGGNGAGSAPSGGGNGRAGSGGNGVSGTIADTVNGAVSGVDRALGGALGRAGVTDVTQGVVDGVAGPNSAVGQAVDRTVEAVRGLLGGGR